MLTKHIEKKLDGNYARMLLTYLNKSWKQHPTEQQLYGHLSPISQTIQVRQTRLWLWDGWLFGPDDVSSVKSLLQSTTYVVGCPKKNNWSRGKKLSWKDFNCSCEKSFLKRRVEVAGSLSKQVQLEAGLR